MSELFKRAKHDSVPNSSHSVKVKVKIMQRVKGCCSHLMCDKQMPQIRTGVVTANLTLTCLVNRPVVFLVAGLFDIQASG